MISGVNNDGDDTMRFILYDSDISKDYGENTTILAWIHSHVETNQCDFLSSVDVHNQRVLEKSFPHIQAIVVELLHTERINHEFYILTTLGKIFCNKPGFHNECQNENYYKQIEGDVSGEAIGERIYDFNSSDHQEILNNRKRKHESNAEILSSDTDSSKSPSKYLATEEETFTCKICDESFDDIKTLIKHINKRKKCQHTNMDEIKRLQIEYLRIKKVELISCLGCKKMFALNDIRVHFTNNKKIDCEQKYIDRNELETLNHKLREHITKTKRKNNARTNAIHNPINNPKRITKFMERKRIYLEYIRKHAPTHASSRNSPAFGDSAWGAPAVSPRPSPATTPTRSSKPCCRGMYIDFTSFFLNVMYCAILISRIFL